METSLIDVMAARSFLPARKRSANTTQKYMVLHSSAMCVEKRWKQRYQDDVIYSHNMKTAVPYIFAANAVSNYFIVISCLYGMAACPYLGAEFVLKTSLEDHEQSDCGRNPFYSCHICDARYVGRGQFNKHVKEHTETVPKKTFQCEICERVLKSKNTLQIHMRIHTNQKPYSCRHCFKSFRNPTDHKQHELAHEGVKLYECPGCSDRFTCNSNLQKHRRVRKDTCGLIPLQSLRVLKSSTKTVKKKIELNTA